MKTIFAIIWAILLFSMGIICLSVAAGENPGAFLLSVMFFWVFLKIVLTILRNRVESKNRQTEKSNGFYVTRA